MVKNKNWVALGFLVVMSQAIFAMPAADPIGEITVPINHPQAAELIESKTSNLRSLMVYYQIALDSGSTVTVPEQISGTTDHPVIKETVTKCIFIICKTLNIDMEFTITKESGPCSLNMTLLGDLRRSDQLLSDVYSDISINLCLQTTPTGGHLKIKGLAIPSASYSQGFIQSHFLDLLKLQMPAITKAVEQSLSH